MTTNLVPSARQSVLAGTCLLLAALASPALCHAGNIDVDIDISPKTINLSGEGVVVTVHTDIPYNQVAGSSVVLFYQDQGVAITSWKSDDLGYFVAKFLAASLRTLEDLVIPGDNEFELCGLTWSGDAFMGSDVVRIVDRRAPRAPEVSEPVAPADR